METIEVEANGIRFTALAEGAGPLVLMLSGFPDDPTTWKAQMAALAAAGYRAVAPYPRGYAPTPAAPDGYYQTMTLARDIAGLIDALGGGEPAFVVGHDWGALGAFAAAISFPEKIRRLVAMSVPYGPRLATAFVTDYAQQKRSWYIFFFQSPMAEMAVAHDDLAFLRNIWRDWSPGWNFTEADIGPVLETFRKPGVVENALAYYRCMLDPTRQDPALASAQMLYGVAPIAVPTLYIHGRRDGCLGVDLVEGMEASFPAGLETMIVDDAGHFVQREKPAEVSGRIVEFLAR